MTEADLQLALDWAAAEGWNPGWRDGAAFYAADPEGFWMGEVEGEAIACISTVCYSPAFAFIGFYIVKPEWRDRGYGYSLWQQAMARLAPRLAPQQRCIGLDGVLEQEATYRKAGFVTAYRHIRHVWESSEELPLSPEVRSLSDIPFDALVAFDTAHFPAPRPAFLRQWIANATAGYAIEEGDALAGYGTIRRCRAGFKIGPLFAHSFETADAIWRSLARHANGQPIFLDNPDINPEAIALAQRYSMQPVFTCARMYSGSPPSTNLPQIFGVTSLELG
jgi:ribosomal protein S18 acetylase RimI-like enzyme